MAGGEKMKYLSGKIDYLIVDEACQCVELSNLIPFCLNPKRVILVGD
jgi:superfamily I DNA and/or RNA helicase